MNVHDATEQCFDGRYTPMAMHEQATIWIHRIGLNLGTTAAELAAFFVDGPGSDYTGGHFPYHYVVTLERVEQALPLDERGAHARRFGNAHGIGIAVCGDFRAAPPTPQQLAWTVELCAELLPALTPMSSVTEAAIPWHLRRGVPVYGHGEVPQAAGADAKTHPDGAYACPGRHLDMDGLRRDVLDARRGRAVAMLKDRGHRIAGR